MNFNSLYTKKFQFILLWLFPYNKLFTSNAKSFMHAKTIVFQQPQKGAVFFCGQNIIYMLYYV
jgi:hypothetical protein